MAITFFLNAAASPSRCASGNTFVSSTVLSDSATGTKSCTSPSPASSSPNVGLSEAKDVRHRTPSHS